MLGQLELVTGLDKSGFAIKVLRDNEPPEGYYLGFSGGKDSVVLYDLAVKAGVKFDAHYCVSPIDPPQIYQFIKEHYHDVIWDRHAKGWWKIVVKNGLPLRMARWCCRVIKEAGGAGRYILIGVRASESSKRKTYKIVETNRADTSSVFVRPMLSFTDYDVWQYIKENNLPYCHLYDEGFKRLGCVLCPFSSDIARQERYFPKIVANWKRACEKIVANTKGRGYLTKRGKPVKHRFETGEELYQWWVSRK